MITLSTDWLMRQWPSLVVDGVVAVPLSRWDEGDAFTLTALGPAPSADQVIGVLTLSLAPAGEAPVIVTLLPALEGSDVPAWSVFAAPDGRKYAAVGRVQNREGPREMAVQIVDVAATLSARRTGLLESHALKDTSVLILGLGTGGIHVALELAKAGVGRFLMMDGDRLNVGNVARHHAGVSNAGRRKVYAARDLVLEKNPAAIVDAHAVAAGPDTEGLVAALLGRCDLVICATDGRPSKLFVNRMAVSAGKTAIYAGAFRRAYGGQVLRVRPRQSPCYQCFVMSMPEEETDREVVSPEDAADIAYADRPVPIEPGLALDVAPIALMAAKLVLQELLHGRETTFAAMDRDFAAPWYFWINRPEPGTPYAIWPALSESADDMTILRWYGVLLDADPGCPVCGDFAAAVTAAHGLEPSLDKELPDRPRMADLPPEG